LALSHAYAIHLDPADEPEAARDMLGKLRDISASLKSHEEKGAEPDRIAVGEALVAARMAEGFLAIRFRPEYPAHAPLAFPAPPSPSPRRAARRPSSASAAPR